MKYKLALLEKKVLKDTYPMKKKLNKNNVGATICWEGVEDLGISHSAQKINDKHGKKIKAAFLIKFICHFFCTLLLIFA